MALAHFWWDEILQTKRRIVAVPSFGKMIVGSALDCWQVPCGADERFFDSKSILIHLKVNT